MNLQRRIATLEKSSPRQSPYAHLSDEELKTELFEVSRRLHAQGRPIDTDVLLWIPESRQFAKEPSWLQDRTHRLDVFLKFRQIIYKLTLPNHNRINSILSQGWMDYRIDKADIDWLVNELSAIELGEEGPWLKEYLEHSGLNEI